MQGYVSSIDTINLHTLHELACEVETCGRSCNCTLVLCKDALEVFMVFFCAVMVLALVDDITRQRSFAESKELLFEFIVRTVVEEAKCTTAACCVVDNFGNHSACLIKEQLVANTNLSCRFYENIPKAHLAV